MLDIITKGIAKIFGSKSKRDIKEVMPLVEEINTLYESFQSLSHDELRNKTQEFKEKIAEALSEINAEIDDLKSKAEADDIDLEEKDQLYSKIDELTESRDEVIEDVLMEILPAAFAVVKETARRFQENESITVKATQLDRDLSVSRQFLQINNDQVTYQTTWNVAGSDIRWNMLHYDVQLIGGIILHKGKIAEMATGEGKTLVATLPSYLNALTGLGVHVVTVNDYLAKRDSEWMAPIFNFLGLTIDCIDKYRPHSAQRIAAYKADIIYGTNNEFGFDYLRDNMSHTFEEQVQRKHHYAMVDEVDSVLIDDARTPLIISGPVPKGDEQEFDLLKPRVERLVGMQKKATSQFLQDAKKLIKEGNTGYHEGDGGLALLRAHRGFPKNKSLINFLSEPGIRQILNKAENYYMQDQNKEMPVCDAKLYYVIDEKNNQIDLTDLGIEQMTQTSEEDNFFVLPDLGAVLAEVESNDESLDEKQQKKDEIIKDFSIKSERLHTVSQLLKAYSLFEKDVEYVVMNNKVLIVDEQTGRIMDGRRYSDGLHQAIEAKEGVKIEAATQTFATITLQNYFRMYHKLAGMTGTAETEAGEFWTIYKLDTVVIPTNRPIIRDDRHDLVYKTKREKYNAIIDEIEELRHAGRPVLVGTTNVEVSELLSSLLEEKKIPHNVLNAKQHAREADIVAEAGLAGKVTIATNMAGRGTDIKLGEGVKEAGGLAIIGSERHDSRRVDRQLRGRSGRQGDPGSSQFYVSLEDDLMRLFGSERLAKVMDRMGYKEGEVIQNGMVTKSIERAQKKVEENNFGIRKRLLEYDDVMNSQREVIYKRRQNALKGERVAYDIDSMLFDLCFDIAETAKSSEDMEALKMDGYKFLGVELIYDKEHVSKLTAETLANDIYDHAVEAFDRRMSAIRTESLPVLKQIQENRGDTVKNILIPLSDGSRTLNITVELEKAIATDGREVTKTLQQNIVLSFIDQYWKEHLRKMDDLRQSVQMAVHEQKDPLLIYKFEAFDLFKAMLRDVNENVVSFLIKCALPAPSEEDLRRAQEMAKRAAAKQIKTTESRGYEDDEEAVSARQAGENVSQKEDRQPIIKDKKIGRNDLCPCGSGKKYKHCHGKNV
ncbi:MAG: preprotein translocase subunit SecA [Chitinophagales bacterium]|nr:preprotein translocase subunit SecA [Chitinophagales bacterium]